MHSDDASRRVYCYAMHVDPRDLDGHKRCVLQGRR